MTGIRRKTMAMLLKMFGHEVAIAYDGIEAIEIAKTFRPDIALLDLSMPRLSGYDAARRIREEAGKPGLVLVALTGWGGEEEKHDPSKPASTSIWSSPSTSRLSKSWSPNPNRIYSCCG
jgi:CheY-like chemotaxis protein